MTNPAKDHEITCLMCAVRALTEGDPKANWVPETPGDTVSGVVLRKGTLDTYLFDRVPFVDLWLGGIRRVRIVAYGSRLRYALDGVAFQVGDRLSVSFDGERTVDKGEFAGSSIKEYSADVRRGH